MRKIILSLIVLSGICIAGRADQFSLTNATFQAMLQSMPVPKFQSVTEGWHNTTTGYTNEYRKDFEDLWKQIDAWPKGEMTNGLFCAVQILQQSGDRGQPKCCVYVANTTTNNYLFLNLPEETTLVVALFDSKGVRVPKIDENQKFSNWTQKQIEDWFEEYNHTHGVGFVAHSMFYAPTKIFSLPQTFQIKQAGEYTLRLQKRLVTDNRDASGKVYFTSIWLPEVVAKVQIRPQDIPPEKLLLNNQTNSPTK